MKKDVLIHILSLIDNGESEDKIEINTKGKAFEKDGVVYLSYKETDENGYDSNGVLIKASDKSVTVNRLGNAKSALIIEAGKRNLCSYATPYGNQMLGISGISVQNKKGEISFCYELDLNNTLLSKNKLQITYKECTK